MGSELLVEACKNGSLQHVELALRKGPDGLNKLSACETTPLHVAVWRNHAGIVSRLLTAGASTDLQDGESGWTALHKALYWGNLVVAGLLLKAGSSLDTADLKGRTPVDLLSAELKPYISSCCTTQQQQQQAGRQGTESTDTAVQPLCTAVYGWGSGANYQLGTGSTDFAEKPVRVEPLGELSVVGLAAAKYHSAAVSADGQLWTWGWGRGGRLGHPDFNIHSGEAALIQPWPVAGLGKRQVVSVAAGKHHMLVATTAGEVWSWGSGRHGKLGYGEIDTQPTPKRVAALQRIRVVAVAAAHKHSAALTSSGVVYTWGANQAGQLGYGTPDSNCNPTPRMVESLKGKSLVALCAAKQHTVVLTAEGEPYTWGHQVVTPRRVNLANTRDIMRCAAPGVAAGAAGSSGAGAGSEQPLVFHKGHAEVMRPVAVAVAAGYTHTSCVTSTGCVLVWCSADPALRVQEVQGALAGLRVVHVSASKTRTAVVTDTGDVYTWEAKEKHGQEGANTQPNTDSKADSSSTRGSTGAGGSMRTSESFQASTSYSGAGQRDSSVLGSSAGASGGMALAGAALGRRPIKGARIGAPIVPVRVLGVKRATQVVVGEKHSMAVSAWSLPPMPDEHGCLIQAVSSAARRASRSDSLDGDFEFDEDDEPCSSTEASPQRARQQTGHQHPQQTPLGCAGMALGRSSEFTTGGQDVDGSDRDSSRSNSRVASLQVLAQQAVATQLVEPRSVLPILEYADAAGAALLRTYCIALALRNLDLVLLEASTALLALPSHLVAELEEHYKAWLQPARGTNLPSSTIGGQSAVRKPDTPPLGSSPISGSWIERAAQASSAPSASLGEATGMALAPELSARRKQQLSKLQAPRRPTSAPPWLDGGQSHLLLPQTGSQLLAHATQAALSAVKHGATHTPVGNEAHATITGAGGISEAAFHPNGQEGAAAAAAEAARLARNVAKKLQQIAALEARAAGSGAGTAPPLDAQQLAKLSQKAALTDALHALELGAPVQVVQQLLSHAQEVAAKLAGLDEPVLIPSSSINASSANNASSTSNESAQGVARTVAVNGSAPLASRRSKSSTQLASSGNVGSSSGSQSVSEAVASPALPGNIAEQHASPTSPSKPVSTSKAASASKDSKADKSARRKGGLSLFLSGALEAPPTPPPAPTPPPLPKGPAWGGAAFSTPTSTGTASLREIHDSSLGSVAVSAATGPSTPASARTASQGSMTALAPVVSVGSTSAAPARSVSSSMAKSGGAGLGVHSPAPVPRGKSAGGQSAVLGLASPAPTTPHSGMRGVGSPAPLPGAVTPAGPSSASKQDREGNASAVKLSLADFMLSKAPVRASQPVLMPPREANSTPAQAWGGAVTGASPSSSSVLSGQHSLKQIQADQEKQRRSAPIWVAGGGDTGAGKHTGVASGSNKPASTSTSATTHGSSPPASKWYVPEPQSRPQNLQAIQTEEAAIKQIAKLYGGHVSISRRR